MPCWVCNLGCGVQKVQDIMLVVLVAVQERCRWCRGCRGGAGHLHRLHRHKHNKHDLNGTAAKERPAGHSGHQAGLTAGQVQDKYRTTTGHPHWQQRVGRVLNRNSKCSDPSSYDNSC